MSEPLPYGVLYRRLLADGRLIDVTPLTFGRARLHIGPADDDAYTNEWCYDDPLTALVSAAIWEGEGEPSGWSRHPKSGRRRPGGDPGKEYVHR
jgi:hypothetical protein